MAQLIDLITADRFLDVGKAGAMICRDSGVPAVETAVETAVEMAVERAVL